MFANPAIASLALPTRSQVPLRKRILLLDAVAFQGVWLACVLSGASGMPLIGLGALVLYAGLHRTIITKTFPRLGGALMLLLAGATADLVLTQSPILRYTFHNTGPLLPPLWILCLWTALAFSMTASLRWLNGRPVLAFILFGLSGALSYRAGIALGAAEITGLVGLSGFAVIYLCFGTIGSAFGAGLIQLQRH
ncbi:MAG: DUF2878 domain-containing protein [Alphaproteobacteria bacterium]